MKEIKITHESCLARGDLIQVETFPFFGVGGVEIVKVFATPGAIDLAEDMPRIAQSALNQAPKRFQGWGNKEIACNQFLFHYGFEIRDDDKVIKVITIYLPGEK